MTTPTVVFIGGYGRSGTTLLDRLLGTVSDDVVSAGEVRHIWQEGFRENRRCGCGNPFAACDFWSSVVARALDDGEPERAERHKRVVDRVRVIPMLASPRRPAAFQHHLDAYGDTLRRLYEAIAAEAGCRVVVDSTKDVAHGWLLRSVPGIELRVVHLVRDSRAVAWSWQRQHFHPGSGRDMDRWGAVRSALEWDAINAITAGLGRGGVPYLRLRYEDLVADPVGAVGRVLAHAGTDPADARVLAGGAVDFGVDHTVAGNPMRFQTGRVELQPDDRWRAAMPIRSQQLVAGLTTPVRAMFHS